MVSWHRIIISVSLIFILLAKEGTSQLPEKLNVQNPCADKAICRECIQTRSCAWCLQPDFGNKPRCFQPNLTRSDSYCSEEWTWNPRNEIEIIWNRELTRSGSASGSGGSASGSYTESGSSSSSSWSRNSSSSWSGSSHASGSSSGSSSAHGQQRIVNISPQRVGLKLRINEEHQLQMKYSRALDYPLDLYYLMDLSKSMEDDKEKLSMLGNVLSDTMRNITRDFQLGFGSFVDKVLMPYVSTVPRLLCEPCPGCEAPYGYHNVMALSTDTYRFSEKVRRANVSGNLDSPEGGFDAIMQVAVCGDRIGWRQQSRRLLVYSTDATFHYAGDGRLGGVVKPNDGKCHMDGRGVYTHSTIQDYPSISQINAKLKQNSINVIFAVTKTQFKIYEKLSKQVEGSSCAILSDDSSNVVELVRNEYNKITSYVEMTHTASSYIKVKYFSSCLGNGPLVETNRCDGLKVGDVVSFTFKISVTSCPQNERDWKQIIRINPVGMSETLIIDLEMLCSCPCERHGVEYKSQKCNEFGDYRCGVCECDEFHFGPNCKCLATDIYDPFLMSRQCRPDSSAVNDCSGRGTCECGTCECDENYYGKFCHCDDWSCAQHNNSLCSGPDHGVCKCGLCQCLPGWTGDVCDCPTTTEPCKNPFTGEICSGHGSCECGACKCDVKADVRYSGTYCEKCPTCPSRCHEFKDCVQCRMYETGPLDDEELCKNNCSYFVLNVTEVVEADEINDERLCTFIDEDDCMFQFVYKEHMDGERVEVRAQKERDCPPKPFIALPLIAAIVCIGLGMLMMWKVFTTVHDRRECARFERERMGARWVTGENPIYRQATSTFKNPTYAGK